MHIGVIGNNPKFYISILGGLPGSLIAYVMRFFSVFRPVSNLFGHSPVRAVLYRVQGTGKTQNQWIVAETDPVSAIFIGTLG